MYYPREPQNTLSKHKVHLALTHRAQMAPNSLSFTWTINEETCLASDVINGSSLPTFPAYLQLVTTQEFSSKCLSKRFISLCLPITYACFAAVTALGMNFLPYGSIHSAIKLLVSPVAHRHFFMLYIYPGLHRKASLVSHFAWTSFCAMMWPSSRSIPHQSCQSMH